MGTPESHETDTRKTDSQEKEQSLPANGAMPLLVTPQKEEVQDGEDESTNGLTETQLIQLQNIDYTLRDILGMDPEERGHVFGCLDEIQQDLVASAANVTQAGSSVEGGTVSKDERADAEVGRGREFKEELGWGIQNATASHG